MRSNTQIVRSPNTSSIQIVIIPLRRVLDPPSTHTDYRPTHTNYRPPPPTHTHIDCYLLGPSDHHHAPLKVQNLSNVCRLSPGTLQGVETMAVKIPDLRQQKQRQKQWPLKFQTYDKKTNIITIVNKTKTVDGH